MSTTSTNSLETKLLAFFQEMANIKEKNNFDSDSESFLFHMTDWRDELATLEQLFNRPDEVSQKDANQILRDLFFHLLPHLNAAAEIYDDAASIYKMHNKHHGEA
jgi:hypothetical protein